jgi:hypothetical protein
LAPAASGVTAGAIVRPGRERAREGVGAGGRAHTCAGRGGRGAPAAGQSAREHRVEPRHEGGAHREVGPRRVEGRGEEHVAVAGHGPRVAADVGEGVGRRGADPLEAPAARDRDGRERVGRSRAGGRGLVGAKAGARRRRDEGAEAPGHAEPGERLVGRAEPGAVGGSNEHGGEPAGCGRLGDAHARRARDGAYAPRGREGRDRGLGERPRRRVGDGGRRVRDEHGEVARVARAPLVGRHAEGAGEPAAGVGAEGDAHARAGRVGHAASGGDRPTAAVVEHGLPVAGRAELGRDVTRGAPPGRDGGGVEHGAVGGRRRAERDHGDARGAGAHGPRPRGGLAVGDHDHGTRAEPRAAGERGRAVDRGRKVAAAGERRGGPHRGARGLDPAAGDLAAGRDQPHAVARVGAVERAQRLLAQRVEHRAPAGDEGRGRGVVEHQGERRRRPPPRPAADEGPRGREGHAREGEHAQGEEQPVAEPHARAVLLLGARQVARRRERHAHARAPAQQVEEQRDRGGAGEGEPEGGEELHGRLWRGRASGRGLRQRRAGGEGPAERAAERLVGADEGVAHAEPGALRAPAGERLGDRGAVGLAHVGGRGAHGEAGLGVLELGVA